MSHFQALLLGVLQGLTEFLPVSSSGHLVLAQNFIPGFSQPGILFDVVLHLGTLLSVFFYFIKQILVLSQRRLLNLVVGSIPAVVVGFIFREQLTALFADTKSVGVALVVSGVVNIIVGFYPRRLGLINPPRAFGIGIAQAIAIIPGISRSGSTIFAGVVSGVAKKEAATFSFLLSIPAVLGASSLELFANRELLYTIDPLSYLAGFVGASVVGFFSIKAVFDAFVSGKYWLFGVYCLALGGVALLLL